MWIFQCYWFLILFHCSFLSLLSFWDSLYGYVGTLDSIPQVSEAVFIFHFFLFVCFCSLHWIISTGLSSSLLIFSSFGSNLLVSPLVNFSFRWLYLSIPKFLTGCCYLFLINSVALLIFPIWRDTVLIVKLFRYCFF